MGIIYNKQLITKDRRIMPSGPRDRQRKQQMENMQPAVTSDSSELIAELRNQISSLQTRLDSTSAGGFTADQVNEEIEKALKVETSDLKAKYEIEVNKVKGLAKELNSIRESHEKELAAKDEIIDQLKSFPVADNNVTALLAEATKKIEDMARQIQFSTTGEVVDPDRPQMETVFVDPIENESKIESHFEVEDISVDEKEQIESKVNKLKNLMGALPLRRG